MSSILRPYQIKGKDDIFNCWREGYRNVMFQLVTGGGKTVLFVDIIKRFLTKNKRVILIAHREELISQAWNTLHKNQIFAGVIKGGVRPNFSLPCQVASIQTIQRRGELPHADLVIIDETHHALDDNSYGKVLKTHYPNALVLGVTATPYRLGGKGFTDLFECLVQGPTFNELVNAGYLTPLEYFVKYIPDLKSLGMSKGDYNLEEAAALMGKNLAPIIESYEEHCVGMSGVVFAVSIPNSREIVDRYNSIGVNAAHLDANTHPDERRNILQGFKERRIQIISNVGIITEGFDFPDMEFVQLARPTKSLSLFLQMVGRVTRTDYNVIKDATDDEVRRFLVSQSKKPFGYVLDNAGLWMDHGLPDQEFDWLKYFQGTKGKKKAPGEFIEMIEYIAEDKHGRRVASRDVAEIEGLKLIHVNKILKEKIVDVNATRKIEELTAMMKRIPKIEKKWFAIYDNFKKHCRKENILITPDLWEYIYNRFVVGPETTISVTQSDADNRIAMAVDRYGNSDEFYRTKNAIEQDTEKKLKQLKSFLMPRGFYAKERKQYEEAIEAGKSGQGKVLNGTV
jgi:superfamily II DNA or RNA helicase/ribosomal protein L31E